MTRIRSPTEYQITQRDASASVPQPHQSISCLSYLSLSLRIHLPLDFPAKLVIKKSQQNRLKNIKSLISLLEIPSHTASDEVLEREEVALNFQPKFIVWKVCF